MKLLVILISLMLASVHAIYCRVCIHKEFVHGRCGGRQISQQSINHTHHTTPCKRVHVGHCATVIDQEDGQSCYAILYKDAHCKHRAHAHTLSCFLLNDHTRAKIRSYKIHCGGTG